MGVTFVRLRMEARASRGSMSDTASESSAARRVSSSGVWSSGVRGSVTSVLPQVTQQVAQRGGAARGMALHRTATDPEGVGDLRLGQVEVVAQREDLALPAGQLPHRVEDRVAPGGGGRHLVGT